MLARDKKIKKKIVRQGSRLGRGKGEIFDTKRSLNI